jgi:hypothetical protein
VSAFKQTFRLGCAESLLRQSFLYGLLNFPGLQGVLPCARGEHAVCGGLIAKMSKAAATRRIVGRPTPALNERGRQLGMQRGGECSHHGVWPARHERDGAVRGADATAAYLSAACDHSATALSNHEGSRLEGALAGIATAPSPARNGRETDGRTRSSAELTYSSMAASDRSNHAHAATVWSGCWSIPLGSVCCGGTAPTHFSNRARGLRDGNQPVRHASVRPMPGWFLRRAPARIGW